MASIPYMANPVGPPWLPASVAEARKLAYWAQILSGVMAVILLIAGIVNLISDAKAPGLRSGGISLIVMGVIALILYILMKRALFDIVDQGKFKESSGRFLILGIIGIFGGVIPGILLLLGYFRIQEVFQPQYQQYHPQNATVAPPQKGQQPAPGQQAYQAPPSQPASQPDQMQTLREGIKNDQSKVEQKKKDQKTEMIKCSKCGVQYPSFMHACPNCNEPKSR
jgi:hypothetical protein